MAPLACAAANLVAALALAFVLAPATPLVADAAERERYVREHLVAWRVGWATWMLAGASLIWMYAWWRRRVGAPRWVLAIAIAGIAADWTAELMLIVGAPGRYADVAPIAFFLTGAVANGLYTLAGIQLTLATPLGLGARVYAALMWSAGLSLSAGAILAIPLVTAIASAELFILFVPWCLWLWRHFRPRGLSA
ncbi:MAG TPA: hypothetical protein VFV20_09765 [Candidatus Limnocylindria bacterium]|nr:hypothetical protein [Candidatus Limnocylindria bacterium]